MRGLETGICALTSNLLKAAVLCYCLFPVHFRHSATSIETHLRFRQRCLLRCVSSFTYGNIQRLEQLHLRSDEKFLFTTDASLQARNSGGRGAILRLTKKTYSLQSLRYKHRTRLRLKQRCLLRCVPLFIYGLFCRPLSGTTSFPEWGALFKVKHYLNVLFYQGNEFVG